MNKKPPQPCYETAQVPERLTIRELTIKHGLSYPSDAELIMLILGSGTKSCPVNELAKLVLNTILSSNSENLVANLTSIKGIGRSKALMLSAAIEFGKRLNRNPQVKLCSPPDLIPYIQCYAMQKQEHFLCISLNGAKEIISIRVICTGTGNMAVIKPADVFAEAIKEHASAIVISHNHPSGTPEPSESDIKTTMRLKHAAELLGIGLIDHIIITKTGYFSFLEHNFLNEEKASHLL